MTITLHWYIVPLLVLLMGIISALYFNHKDRDEKYAGLFGMAVFLASVVIASIISVTYLVTKALT